MGGGRRGSVQASRGGVGLVTTGRFHEDPSSRDVKDPGRWVQRAQTKICNEFMSKVASFRTARTISSRDTDPAKTVGRSRRRRFDRW